MPQAGVGEYKILKQLHNVVLDPYWVNNYDCVIVFIQVSRIHTSKHPVHKEGLHKDCDLIYSDLEKDLIGLTPSLKTAKNWFWHPIMMMSIQIDIYNMIREKIKSLYPFHIWQLIILRSAIFMPIEDNILDLTETWPEHRGNINHYTVEGNPNCL